MMNSESLEQIREVRRHHRRRIIHKRYERVQIGHWHVKRPGYLAKNNTVCSCWMCGNPRKYFGEVTRQEKISEESSLGLTRSRLFLPEGLTVFPLPLLVLLNVHPARPVGPENRTGMEL